VPHHFAEPEPQRDADPAAYHLARSEFEKIDHIREHCSEQCAGPNPNTGKSTDSDTVPVLIELSIFSKLRIKPLNEKNLMFKHTIGTHFLVAQFLNSNSCTVR
jgi:hypothetical protein